MNKLGLCVLSLLPLSALLLAVSAGCKEVTDEAHGKVVFEQWCAPCHAAGPYHPGTQALEAKYHGALPAALEQRKDLKRPYVRQVVRSGVSVMPFFRQTEISDTALDDLSAYLAKSR